MRANVQFNSPSRGRGMVYEVGNQIHGWVSLEEYSSHSSLIIATEGVENVRRLVNTLRDAVNELEKELMEKRAEVKERAQKLLAQVEGGE